MSGARVVRGLIAGLVLLAGSGAVLSGDHSWNGYHWARTANPFTLKVGDNVSSAWDAYLDEAIIDWSASAVLDLTKVAGGTKPRSCRPTTGRIEVCNERYGNTGWLGIAQIWITDGTHITQAITKLNDTYFNTRTYNTPPWRRLVMCQEIAHDFGLDHQDENFENLNLGSCMDYTNDPDGPISNEHPNAHDYEQVEAIYAHVDSVSTVEGAPGFVVQARPPGLDAAFETPAQWGRLIRSIANGRVQVFELDFGRGFHVITRVVWADQR